MSRYIVFDVETPNRYNNRMSAIGICVVEGRQIVKQHFSLVDPEQPFDWFNTQLTGISEESVTDAPTFPQLWRQIEPVMSSGILVAHNASFDMRVLRKCLNDYGIGWKPRVQGLCTVLMGRSLKPGISHRLNDMCEILRHLSGPSSGGQRQPGLRRDIAAIYASGGATGTVCADVYDGVRLLKNEKLIRLFPCAGHWRYSRYVRKVNNADVFRA